MGFGVSGANPVRYVTERDKGNSVGRIPTTVMLREYESLKGTND